MTITHHIYAKGTRVRMTEETKRFLEDFATDHIGIVIGYHNKLPQILVLYPDGIRMYHRPESVEPV